ncbi:hypothetical protein [Acrocarpospora sp. B8E8]|uniref:hypothetical protein n=1 Tax=Acrocarpospora sp. B8E8 TaxID=3153572 RepID=UPI00325ED32A
MSALPVRRERAAREVETVTAVEAGDGRGPAHREAYAVGLGEARAAAVQGVEVEGRGAALDELGEGDVIAEGGRGAVHGEVVVDELAEVGETRANPAILLYGLRRGHRSGQFGAQRGIDDGPHQASREKWKRRTSSVVEGRRRADFSWMPSPTM